MKATHQGVAHEARFIPRPAGGELYTVLTTPAGAAPSRVVLVCPPTFEEHGRSYVILRELARRLGAAGIATLRFDYVGVGESLGEPDAFTMSAATADIAFLASWLRERFPAARLVPLGVRFGARLVVDALAAMIRDPKANLGPPILWDPVLDARDYILGELRSTISSAMVVYQSAVATREDIVKETLEGGSCERQGFKLNQIDGYMVTRELLRDAQVQEASPPPWSYPDPVIAMVAVQPGDGGERQKKKLAPRLPAMTFRAIVDDQYWNQPPIYNQMRENLFEATRQVIER